MSYRQIISETEDEFKLKRHRAEYDAQARFVELLKKYPELDAADTLLRKAMREFGFQLIPECDVNMAKKHFKEVLDNLNIDDCSIKPQYDCSICNDTGKTGRGRCSCFMNRVYSRLYKEADLITATSQCFDNFDLNVFPADIPNGYKSSQRSIMTKVLKQATQYSNSFPENDIKNILLMGSAGVGKTYLANCIAKSVLDKGYSVLSTTSFGMFEKLSERLSGKEVDLDHIRNTDLLFIDDLGMEPTLNNFTIEYLFEILNIRIKRFKNTIITTNLTIDELRNRYTERITSRLFDRLHSQVIYLPGKDIRQIKR